MANKQNTGGSSTSNTGTDLVLVGKPDQLKPALTTILAIAQLLDELREYKTPPAYKPKRANKASIRLHFKESKSSYIKAGRNYPYRGEISFRLMDVDPKMITETMLQNATRKIIDLFAKPPFQWHKGKEMSSYTYWEDGYQLQLLVKDYTEGKRVVEQVLDIRGKSPDWEYMSHEKNSAPQVAYKDTPKQVTILGKSVEQPVERPVVTVQFDYADIYIPGLRKPIILCDLSGRREPLVQIETKIR
jgi:hypothetical protein